MAEKKLTKMSIIQPILTIVLVVLLALLIFKFDFGGIFDRNKSGTINREITQKITFDAAVNKYLSGNYIVYTRGNLYTKPDSSNLTPISPTETPSITPSTNEIVVLNNPYNDLFFYINQTQIKKIDLVSYGKKESQYFDEKGNLISLNDTDKTYSIYPIPDDSELEAKLLFETAKRLLDESFPLTPLIRDYKNGTFSPTERSYNLYVGKWKHNLFTSGETADVILETDPVSGLFTRITFVHLFTDTPSQITFDFKNNDNPQIVSTIPQDYKKIDTGIKYKEKSIPTPT